MKNIHIHMQKKGLLNAPNPRYNAGENRGIPRNVMDHVGYFPETNALRRGNSALRLHEPGGQESLCVPVQPQQGYEGIGEHPGLSHLPADTGRHRGHPGGPALPGNRRTGGLRAGAAGAAAAAAEPTARRHEDLRAPGHLYHLCLYGILQIHSGPAPDPNQFLRDQLPGGH